MRHPAPLAIPQRIPLPTSRDNTIDRVKAQEKTKTITSSFSARDYALSLAEIVEGIMMHLPPGDILNARRVSRIWNHQWRHSKAVHLAAVIYPHSTGMLYGYQLRNQLHTETLCCVPHYGDETDIKIHPRLVLEDPSKDNPQVCRARLRRDIPLQQLDDFLTNPPCLAAGLHAHRGTERLFPPRTHTTQIHSMVRKTMGVRLRDVLELAGEMDGHEREHPASISIFLACDAWKPPASIKVPLRTNNSTSRHVPLPIVALSTPRYPLLPYRNHVPFGVPLNAKKEAR